MSRKKGWRDLCTARRLLSLFIKQISDKVAKAHYQKQHPVTLVLKGCVDMIHMIVVYDALICVAPGKQIFLFVTELQPVLNAISF